MAVASTTKMMNLLTLVLVTLPGLTLSFSNANPWRQLYERVQAGAYPLPRTQTGGYVCCNMPPTPPSPAHLSQFRSLLLSLTKRDDRNAPFRKARMNASGWMGDARSLNIPGASEGGSYSETDAARRDPLLVELLNMLKSSGRHRGSQFSSRDILSRSADSRTMDFNAPAYVGKRGRGRDDARPRAGKRTFGDLGGANMDWV